jgi:hypothetical protein
MRVSATAKHPSNSEPQKKAELEMRIILQKELGCNLKAETIRSSTGESMEVDGYSKPARVLCEIYAHFGRLKGSQPDKPLVDAIKMTLAEKWLGGSWRKIIAFADVRAASSFQNGSWRANAMRLLGIEIKVVSLKIRSAKSVTKAQHRQNMGNVPK